MRFPCPRCRRQQAGRVMPHCPSPTCPWFYCRVCDIAFDRAGRRRKKALQ